jgi:hypothetical protein
MSGVKFSLQVRYATGAIRNISVEEVGRRIVKAIPNVLPQLTTLSSSNDQVTRRCSCLIVCSAFSFLLCEDSLASPRAPLAQATARYAAAALKSLS